MVFFIQNRNTRIRVSVISFLRKIIGYTKYVYSVILLDHNIKFIMTTTYIYTFFTYINFSSTYSYKYIYIYIYILIHMNGVIVMTVTHLLPPLNTDGINSVQSPFNLHLFLATDQMLSSSLIVRLRNINRSEFLSSARSYDLFVQVGLLAI